MDTTNISKTEAYSKIWRPIFSSGCTVGFLILMGSTRVIQWMESPLTKEGILFASLFIGTAATFGSRLANSSDLEKYSKIVSIGGAMLGSIALLYFASVFVNYANLEISSLRAAAISYTLYKFFTSGLYKELTGDEKFKQEIEASFVKRFEIAQTKGTKKNFRLTTGNAAHEIIPGLFLAGGKIPENKIYLYDGSMAPIDSDAYNLIKDSSNIPSIKLEIEKNGCEQIKSFLRKIDDLLKKKCPVVLHSKGRDSCTSMIICFLIFRYKVSFDQALHFVCNKRNIAYPVENSREFILRNTEMLMKLSREY